VSSPNEDDDKSRSDEEPSSGSKATAKKPRDAKKTEEKKDDAKPPWRKMILLTFGLFLALEILARVVLGYRASAADTEFAKQYPPNTYITSFSARQDYRQINLFTMNPERGSGPEFRFDAMGFRLDKRDLRFEAAQADTQHKHLWMLGSSTLQGVGVRESETIASYLNDLFEKDGSPWRVYNLGQGGFTSTQELLLLIELLQAGYKPDALVVYDGASDVSFDGDITKTGTPGWEKHTTAARVMLDIQGGESASALTTLAITRLTKLDDFMAGIMRRSNAKAAAPGATPADRGGTSYPGDNWDVVARRYLVNLNLIHEAARFLKVPSFFFFQPVMQYEDHYKLRTYSDYETTKLIGQMATNEWKRRDALLKPENDAMRASLGLRDIHDVFRHHDGETLWADPRHPNGKGNEIIAARIMTDLRAELAKPAPDAP